MKMLNTNQNKLLEHFCGITVQLKLEPYTNHEKFEYLLPDLFREC